MASSWCVAVFVIESSDDKWVGVVCASVTVSVSGTAMVRDAVCGVRRECVVSAVAHARQYAARDATTRRTFAPHPLLVLALRARLPEFSQILLFPFNHNTQQ